MRRRHVHAAFAIASTLLAAFAASEAVTLHRATRVAAVVAGQADAAPELPEARLMRALAMGEAGRFEDALAELKPLTRTEDEGLRLAALYDLGNLHLREGTRRHATAPEEALPYIELAKQHYRDVLRQRPTDWDARYNLERALWLAPEEEQVAMDAAPPVPSERAITTMRGGKAALP
ncbi:MAG: hypothetical protein KDH20_17735 [Rhodocyclaceae bacterium]|nr:hypothetical protein [Rhodocyclaceae bacterium]